MTASARLMCGLILITVPTIEFGGYFLLKVVSGKMSRLSLTPFQQGMFRAGHAHAGVLLLLSLICQLLADEASLSAGLIWLVRIGVPVSTLLISGGFFAAAAGRTRTAPNQWIGILYTGVLLLAVCVLTLGIGLL
ncbi:hypothetical protein HGH93_11615 [Chitinophaga polysaccharea]|uniref:hypothetical protein n=1 Tax=Chitinophaga TaxID=79328 RepID=UPI00145547B4|nr:MULTISPECIES: hypothetical protein [Chitinophaga]NLR58755.1 hypothetical protein [Chitinophaga polysaccharea]NLU91286.1 hypothetical protein [Chitinophaga sp. Ak27]